MTHGSLENIGVTLAPPGPEQIIFLNEVTPLKEIYPDTKSNTEFPLLSDMIKVSHRKLDITWMPEGSEPLHGWFHLEGHVFTHKDSKDPEMLIEELGNGDRKYHIYFTRGVARDVIAYSAHDLVPDELSDIDNTGDDLIVEEVERWEVGHLISDSANGPWTEIETAKMRGVEDKPQMCAPSVFYADGLFHMIIQGACFFDNHPIYHFTSTNGTDFTVRRKLLEPLPGTTEAGIYDVDIIEDDGRRYIVYSAMAPMTEKRKAVNEIHLAYIPSLEGEEEAERLVELEKGLWARVVKCTDSQYGYFLIDDEENISRIVKLENGSFARKIRNVADEEATVIFADGHWHAAQNQENLDESGYFEAPQPGSPVISHTDVPGHNVHPPRYRDDETILEQINREQLEVNFEWGLEGMQVLRLPNGLYLLLGVCFLRDLPIGKRQRTFMAVSEKITGPYVPIATLIDPAEDSKWGDGENGHASATIVGDKLHILYQARRQAHRELPIEEQLAARWTLGEAECDIKELCHLAEQAITAQTSPSAELYAA